MVELPEYFVAAPVTARATKSWAEAQHYRKRGEAAWVEAVLGARRAEPLRRQRQVRKSGREDGVVGRNPGEGWNW